MKGSMLFHLLLIMVLGVFSSACQQDHKADTNPSENDKWQLVHKVEGHHEKITEPFHLSGNPVMVTYEAESEGHYTHSRLNVQLGTGGERQWDNPQITLFNQEHAHGAKHLQSSGGRYLLKIDPINVHYHIEVYQKQSVNSGAEQSDH